MRRVELRCVIKKNLLVQTVNVRFFFLFFVTDEIGKDDLVDVVVWCGLTLFLKLCHRLNVTPQTKDELLYEVYKRIFFVCFR